MEAHLSATGGLYTPDIAQQHAHLLHSTQNTNPYAATANQELFHDPNAPMYYVDEYGNGQSVRAAAPRGHRWTLPIAR